MVVISVSKYVIIVCLVWHNEFVTVSFPHMSSAFWMSSNAMGQSLITLLRIMHLKSWMEGLPAAWCAFLACWTNYFVTLFRVHRIARSSTAMFVDLLLVCYLANTTCAIINIMTTHHSHCLSVTCIPSCYSNPLFPPRACGSCGDFLFPTDAIKTKHHSVHRLR